MYLSRSSNKDVLFWRITKAPSARPASTCDTFSALVSAMNHSATQAAESTGPACGNVSGG